MRENIVRRFEALAAKSRYKNHKGECAPLNEFLEDFLAVPRQRARAYISRTSCRYIPAVYRHRAIDALRARGYRFRRAVKKLVRLRELHNYEKRLEAHTKKALAAVCVLQQRTRKDRARRMPLYVDVYLAAFVRGEDSKAVARRFGLTPPNVWKITERTRADLSSVGIVLGEITE